MRQSTMSKRFFAQDAAWGLAGVLAEGLARTSNLARLAARRGCRLTTRLMHLLGVAGLIYGTLPASLGWGQTASPLTTPLANTLRLATHGKPAQNNLSLDIRGAEIRILRNRTIHIQQAQITYGEWRFEADSMHWDKRSNILKSQSKVVFYNETIQGHASQLVINTENGKAVLQNPVAQAFATPGTAQANQTPPNPSPSPSQAAQAQKAETAANVDLAQAMPAQAALHFSAKTLFLTQAAPSADQAAEPLVFHQGSIDWQQWNVQGNTMMLWLPSRKIEAQGDVRLTSQVLRVKAQSLQGNLTQTNIVLQKAHVTRLDTGMQITSERAVLNQDGTTSTLYTCTISVCPAPPFWQVKADKLDFAPNETGVAINAVLKIYNTRLLWVPWFAFPVGNARRSGFLTPSLSRETSSDTRFNLGARVQLPFFWAPHPSLDFTFTPELTENRQPSLHVEHRYTYRPNQWGLLQGWVGQAQSKDSQKGTLSREEDIPRYWFDYGHRQQSDDGRALHLRVRHASDGLVGRQYQQQTDRPWQSYRLGLSQQWQALDVALLAEHRVEYNAETLADNTRQQTTYRGSVRQIPILRQWGGWDVTLGRSAHVFFHLQSAAWRFDSPGRSRGQAALLQPGVALPFRLGPFEVRPLLEQRMVTFERLTQQNTSLPQQQFQQTQATTTVLLPLLNTSASAQGNLIVKRLIPTLQLQWRQNVAPFSQARVVGERPAVRRLALRVSHYWHQQTNPAAALVENASLHLTQPYDALRRADAPSLKISTTKRPLTNRGQPWQPIIAHFRWQRPNWQGSHQVHHHHQQKRVHRWQTNLRYNSLRWGWSFGAAKNKFNYLDSEQELQAKTATTTTAIQLRTSARQQWSLNAQIDLQSASQRPLGRRLQTGGLAWKYRGVCHQVGLAMQRNVVGITNNINQTTTYSHDTKYTLSFSLNTKAYTPTLEQEAQFTASNPSNPSNPSSACRI